MCISQDYKKDDSELQRSGSKKRLKSLRSTSARAGSSDDSDVQDDNDVAFRQTAIKAKNEDIKNIKHLELHKYIEGMRNLNYSQMFDFIKGMDPKTEPKHVKLMYYYFVGSKHLYNEMKGEVVEDYLSSSKKMQAESEHQSLTKTEAQLRRQKIKDRYGRPEAIQLHLNQYANV